jgi:hypothetical protein
MLTNPFQLINRVTKAFVRNRGFLLAITMLLSLFCSAGVEPFTNSTHGSLRKGDTLLVKDEKFRSAVFDWKSIERQKVVNIISFAIWQDTNHVLPPSLTCNIRLKIEYYSSPDQPEPLHIQNVSMRVRYKKDSLLESKMMDTYQFENAHWVKITVEEISSEEFGDKIPPYLQLTSQVIVDRKYKFDPDKKLHTTYEVVKMDKDGTSKEGDPAVMRFNPSAGPQSYGIRMTWDAQGYDEFDLEWTSLDRNSGYDNIITQIQNGTVAPQTLTELFRFKSTRVTTHANNYTVTLTHYNSFIFFRVRHAQYSGGVRLEGVWDYMVNSSYALFDIEALWHEPNLNWQFTAVYAEDGKKKEGIIYYDGKLLPRQILSINDNRDQVELVDDSKRNAIVEENIYDEFGRKIAAIMPAPIAQSVFAYQPRQTLTEGGQIYRWQNVIPGGACETKPDKISNAAGAGKYYSPANPFGVTGMNAYIPDAEGYPLMVTRYTGDNSGKLKLKGAPGELLQPNSTNSHATKFFYGKPEQRELDKIFGNDAGYAEHYLKNVEIDGNGQAVISYVNASGKVVASALSGQSPPNLDGLANKPAPVYETKTIIRPRNFQYDYTNLTLSATSTYIATVEGSATLAFDIEKLIYQYTQPGWSFCANCYYDLTIKVYDDCGTQVYHNTTPKKIGTDQAGCLNSGLHNESLPINFPKRGEYNISFEFKLSRDAMEAYTNAYIEERKTRGDWKTEFRFVDDYMKLENFSTCFQDCATCEQELGTKTAFVNNAKDQLVKRGITTSPAENTEMTNWLNTLYDNLYAQCQALKANCNYSPCDRFKNLLLQDVSPGGQYAVFGNNSAPLETELNVLYLHWREQFPVLYPGHPTYEADIIEKEDGTRTSPYDASFTLDMLVAYWKPEWAEKFLQYHPEYCKLQFCNNNSNYFNWDNQVNEEIQSAAAIQTHHSTTPAQYSYSTPDWLVNKDPFFQPGGLGYNYSSDMRLDLQLFASRVLKVTQMSDKSITQFVDYLLYCINPSGNTNTGNTADNWNSCVPAANCRIPDKEWALYKEWYFQAKEKYYELARNATTCLNVCPVGGPIGIPTGGCPTKNDFSIMPASTLVNYGCGAGQVAVRVKYLKGKVNGTVTLTMQYPAELAGLGLPAYITFNNQESEKIICISDQVPLSSMYITAVNCSGGGNPDPNYCPFGNGGSLNITGTYQQTSSNTFVVTNAGAGTRTTYTLVSGNANQPPADNIYCPNGTVVLKQFYNCYRVYLPNISAPALFFNVWVIGCQEDLCANATVYNLERQISQYVFSAGGNYYYIQSPTGGTNPPCANPTSYPQAPCIKVYVQGNPTPYVFYNATVKVCPACAVGSNQSIYVTGTGGTNIYTNVDGTYYIYPNTTPTQIMFEDACPNPQRSWVSCLTINLNGVTTTVYDATVFFCPAYVDPCQYPTYFYADYQSGFNQYHSTYYYTPYCAYSTMDYYVVEGYGPIYPPYDHPYCPYNGDGGWQYYECVRFVVNGYETTYYNAWVWSCWVYTNNCGGGGGGGGGCRQQQDQLATGQFKKAFEAQGFRGMNTRYIEPCEQTRIASAGFREGDRFYTSYEDSRLYHIRPVKVDKKGNPIGAAPQKEKAYTAWEFKSHYYIRTSEKTYLNLRNIWIAAYDPYQSPVKPVKRELMDPPQACIEGQTVFFYGNLSIDWCDGMGGGSYTITTANGQPMPPGQSTYVTVIIYNQWGSPFIYDNVYFGPGDVSHTICISASALSNYSYIELCSGWTGPGDDPPPVVCPELLQSKTPRFIVIDYSTVPYDVTGMVNTGLQDLQQQIINSCEGMADYWINALTPCFTARGLNATQIDIIRTKLIEVCTKGGDLEHPSGSSTIRPGETAQYNSFKAVILGQLGISSIDMLCNPWLLESPYPWATKAQAVSQTIANTSPELCTKLAQLQQEHTSTNPGVTLYQYILNKYGAAVVNITEQELNYIIKGCNNCKYLLDKDVPLPVFLDPGAKGCIVKADWDAALIAFNNEFLPGSPDVNHANYADIFSTYLNHRWGFTLTYDDYNDYKIKLQTQPGAILCNEPVYSPVTANLYQCVNSLMANAITNGQREYEVYVETQKRIFRMNYTTTCLGAKSNVRLTSQEQTYQYTLTYYDLAGNIAKTVSPAGVSLLNETQLAQVEAARETGSAPFYPPHSMVTGNQYNSMGQIITQVTPDAGTTNFWYDLLGRMVASQNAEQLSPSNGGASNRYTYTAYDALGRISEVGEKESPPITFTNPGFISEAVKNIFLGGGINKQITQTVYDLPASGAGITTGLAQDNLRKRIAASIYKSTAAGAAEQVTYYNYDAMGNIKTMWQQVSGIALKKIDYEYDLVSGKINAVRYQDGQSDRFYYQYSYDAENRILKAYSGTEAFVTLNGTIDIRPLPTTHLDAEYKYYLHGLLARTELGKNKVQGLDYVYTLQGWTKGVNGHKLNAATEIGEDGKIGSSTANNGRDAMAYSLGYFEGDYKPIGLNAGTAPAFGMTFTAPSSGNGVSLYDGNIGHITLALSKINNGDVAGYTYRYDQLNRLVNMKYHELGNPSGWNNTTGISTQKYNEAYTYDPNGNISTLVRNGHKPATPVMDNLSYVYQAGTNKLNYVADAVADNVYTDAEVMDLSGQSPNNYTYDNAGNLKSDVREGITNIGWTATGRIRSISKSDNSSLQFVYDATGTRVKKIYTSPGGLITTTYYVKDHSGNTLAIYDDFQKKEQQLYGNGRLGTWKPTPQPSREYELVNHLKNVFVTISDQKIPVDEGSNGSIDYYTADVLTTSDYYPFGMGMAARQYTATSSYRYGFNGQEKDDEVKGPGNALNYTHRMSDPRIARFFSEDPIASVYPELTPYQIASNNPIMNTELEGLEGGNSIAGMPATFGVGLNLTLGNGGGLQKNLKFTVGIKTTLAGDPSLKIKWLDNKPKFGMNVTNEAKGTVTFSPLSVNWYVKSSWAVTSTPVGTFTQEYNLSPSGLSVPDVIYPDDPKKPATYKNMTLSGKALTDQYKKDRTPKTTPTITPRAPALPTDNKATPNFNEGLAKTYSDAAAANASLASPIKTTPGPFPALKTIPLPTEFTPPAKKTEFRLSYPPYLYIPPVVPKTQQQQENNQQQQPGQPAPEKPEERPKSDKPKQDQPPASSGG